MPEYPGSSLKKNYSILPYIFWTYRTNIQKFTNTGIIFQFKSLKKERK